MKRGNSGADLTREPDAQRRRGNKSLTVVCPNCSFEFSRKRCDDDVEEETLGGAARAVVAAQNDAAAGGDA